MKIMRSTLLLLLFFCIAQTTKSQAIYLDRLINDIYYNNTERVYKKHNINYIVDVNLAIIEKEGLDKVGVGKFSLKFHKKEDDFVCYLKNANRDNEEEIIYVSILGATPKSITLEVKYYEVTLDNFIKRMFTFIDERKVLLEFDEQTSSWVYAKTLEIKPES